MTVTGLIIKNIIRKLLTGQDYRSEVLTLIDAEFLQFVVDFFKQIVKAKLNKESVTADWYTEEFLSSNSLSNSEVFVYSGTDTTTILNSQQIVLDTILKYHDALSDAFNSLGNNLDMAFTIKFRNVSFGLNLNECLILFNTLAFKRSTLQDRLWSETSKQVEKPLMATLCALFQVPQKYYDQGNLPDSQRESDFYLFDDTGKGFPCEVKLMGKGNPESADAVYARNSRVLVANTLSDLNKEQMDENGIFWVELKDTDDYKRFEHALNALSIPCKPFVGDLQGALDKILPIILSDDVQDSVTPEAVLREREQDDDSGSQLLVEFE
jgi:hypothetical protein